jgi:hypothetical protein
MNRTTGWIIGSLLLILLIAGIVFLALNFRLAQSQANSGYNLSTGRSGDELPLAMRQSPSLTVAVMGEGPLADALRQVLERQLVSNPQLAFVDVFEGAPETVYGPYLLLEPQTVEVVWTPVYARADLEVAIDFDSAGDLTSRGTPYIFSSEEAPQIKSGGEIRVENTAFGLISRPGYYTMLAELVVNETDRAIIEIYTLPQ